MRVPRLGIVVVLYRLHPADSTALTTLAASLPAVAEPPFVMVHDNTEGTGAADEVPDFVDRLSHDPRNPGLAVAYQRAADEAAAAGCAWLLLLDQDTHVTPELLGEVDALVAEGGVPDGVDVLVPRVVDGVRVLSPHRPVRLRTRPVRTRAPGVVQEPCTWINSGAVLRLSAVRAAGGFPADYPLDYLDHAMAARLRSGGSRVMLLRSVLRHHLSLLDRGTLGVARLDSVLRAEEHFHLEHGSRRDLGWLVVRRVAGAVLAATHVRPSPSVAAEVAAARRATSLLGHARWGGRRG